MRLTVLAGPGLQTGLMTCMWTIHSIRVAKCVLPETRVRTKSRERRSRFRPPHPFGVVIASASTSRTRNTGGIGRERVRCSGGVGRTGCIWRVRVRCSANDRASRGSNC